MGRHVGGTDHDQQTGRARSRRALRAGERSGQGDDRSSGDAAPDAARRTTVVYAQHPHDEALLLSPHLVEARRRGDRLVLVACAHTSRSSHGAGGGAPADGTPGRGHVRAWALLAGTDSPVIDLGFARGQVPAEGITAVARALDAVHGPGTRHHAVYPDGALTADHEALARGLDRAGVEVLHGERSALYAVPTTDAHHHLATG